MSDYILEGTCGACKEFEFEGNDKKGYCRWYKQYFWDRDSCSHYEGRETSGGGGCFLTSACCRYKGLPDDCAELTALRAFRDGYLMQSEEGKQLVEEYYRIAPAIVEEIDKRTDKDAIYERIYSAIRNIMAVVEQGEKDEAVRLYRSMVIDVQTLLEQKGAKV